MLLPPLCHSHSHTRTPPLFPKKITFLGQTASNDYLGGALVGSLDAQVADDPLLRTHLNPFFVTAAEVVLGRVDIPLAAPGPSDANPTDSVSSDEGRLAHLILFDEAFQTRAGAGVVHGSVLVLANGGGGGGGPAAAAPRRSYRVMIHIAKVDGLKTEFSFGVLCGARVGSCPMQRTPRGTKPPIPLGSGSVGNEGLKGSTGALVFDHVMAFAVPAGGMLWLYVLGVCVC